MTNNILNDDNVKKMPVGIESFETFGERTYLTLANHTKIDLHIQVTGDVHTGNWGPNQVNHNEEPQIKSRKIDIGNKATYNIFIWKNDSGQPGQFIGEFDHQVRYNGAGNADHLEFSIIKIEEDYYFRAISARTAGEIALILILNS